MNELDIENALSGLATESGSDSVPVADADPVEVSSLASTGKAPRRRPHARRDQTPAQLASLAKARAAKIAQGKAAKVLKHRNIDWAKAERLYRAGRLSVKDIAETVGCKLNTLLDHVDAGGWRQDQREQANELAAVALRLDGEIVFPGDVDSDKAGIAAQAAHVLTISRRHAAIIHEAREATAELLTELRITAANRAKLEEYAHLVALDQGTLGAAERARLMRQAVSLPTHSGVIKNLAGAIRNLVELERTAFGMTAKRQSEAKGDTLSDWLARLPPPSTEPGFVQPAGSD